jgi:hypothetical protein
MPRPRRSLALLVVPALTLAACGGGGDGGGGGGGNSDKDTLTTIINAGSSNPASVCDHLDAALLKQVGGAAGCKKAAASEPKGGSTTIHSLKVDGDKATAKVTGRNGATTITFAKQDGEWKVTASQ